MTVISLKCNQSHKLINTLYYFTGNDPRITLRKRVNRLVKSQLRWLVAEFTLESRIPNILYN